LAYTTNETKDHLNEETKLNYKVTIVNNNMSCIKKVLFKYLTSQVRSKKSAIKEIGYVIVNNKTALKFQLNR